MAVLPPPGSSLRTPVYFSLLGALLLLGSLLPSARAVLAQESKLTASDGAVGDAFGNAVAVEGRTALVGVRQDDDAGDASGAAFVFAREDGVWREQAKLTAADAARGDRFGTAVALSGSYAAVGATGDDDGGSNAGAVYVFKRTGTTWTEQAKLVSSTAAANDGFGVAVALHGNRVLIGSGGDDAAGENAGAVYLFERTGTTWTEQAKLVAGDALAADGLGGDVALGEDLAVAGAVGHDTPPNLSGAVYVFAWDGAAWTQQAKLTASDGGPEDEFGNAVALDGALVLVGMARGDAGGEEAGAAYVFTQSGTRWTRQATLRASEEAAGDAFGTAVGLRGGLAVVGAPGDDDGGADAGAAYVFAQNGTAWTQQATLHASDAAAGDAFGDAVAFRDGHALVAAPEEDGRRGPRGGAVYAVALAVPPAPLLAVPADGAAGLPAEVAFRWQAVGAADRYGLQVAPSASFAAPVIDQAAVPDTSFLATDLAANTRYFWRVAATNAAGTGPWSAARPFTVGTPVGLERADDAVPAAFRLAPTYPNPFARSTTISFALARAGRVRLTVYSVQGTAVATLVAGTLVAGHYTVTWEAAGVPSGVYLLRMQAGGSVWSRSLVIQR